MSEVERLRTLDIARRLKSVRTPALLAALVVAVVGVQSFGLWMLAPIVVAGLGGYALQRSLPRVDRPEVLLFAALPFFQATVIGGLIAMGDYRLDGLGLLILPVVAASLIYPPRLTLLAVLESVVVMVAAAFVLDPQRVLDLPPVLIIPLGTMLCVPVPGAAVRRLDLAARSTAVADPLTGALNRAAFDAVLVELGAMVGGPDVLVGVIVVDLDRFKSVNDDLGHQAGDEVLRESVLRMRDVLGIFTPVHRIGGEEFAILVRGAGPERVRHVADRLRLAISSRPIHGRTITASFGVITGSVGRVPVTALVEAADRALYRAKAEGRDRVVVADEAAGAELADQLPARRETDLAPQQATAALAAAPRATARDRARAARPADTTYDGGNWLVRGEFERDHMRELAHALSRTHGAALGFSALALLCSIPWLGWQLLVPALITLIAYHSIERRIMKVRRPEYVLGGAWLAVQASICAGAFLADVVEPFLLILLIPMMIGNTAIYPVRGTSLNVVCTVVLIAIAGLAGDAELVFSMPGLLLPAVGVTVCMGLLGSVSGSSAIEHRARAAVDPLTGLLNRAALTARVAEISRATKFSTTSTAVITVDIDGFKTLNDTRGHAVGDTVLRAVGAALRDNLRAFEWAFRVGGDEFVIVVPGEASGATALAERLRAKVAEIDVDGVSVTGSFGVAATSPGEPFDYETVLGCADEALYQAKRDGRNCVVTAAAREDVAEHRVVIGV